MFVFSSKKKIIIQIQYERLKIIDYSQNDVNFLYCLQMAP